MCVHCTVHFSWGRLARFPGVGGLHFWVMGLKTFEFPCTIRQGCAIRIQGVIIVYYYLVFTVDSKPRKAIDRHA